MKTSLICALLGLSLASPLLQAQTAPAAPAQAAPSGTALSAQERRSSMAFNAQMFYQLLVAEMSAAQGDAGAAITLLADAARKSGDAQLYQRATDLALAARSGDNALQLARQWRQAHPRSPEAHRYLLQILLALNRVAESGEPLKSLLEITPDAERGQLVELLPALYARASDKKLASVTVEQALAPMLVQGRPHAPGWTTVARLRAGAGDAAGALDALQRAQAADPTQRGAALLALELMDPKRPRAEEFVRTYLERAQPAAAEVRLGYARALAEGQRLRESESQLEKLTREQPEAAEAWLLLGSLQAEAARHAQAEASLQRYLELTQQQQAGRTGRGLAQAYLLLAEIAEKRGDLAGAERWLNMHTSGDLLVQAQTRRASLLARQGKLPEARELIRKLPERDAGDARLKLLAELNLLREFKQHQAAFDLLARASAAAPQDVDLLYEQALMAEKLGRLEEMERLLRRALEIKPDYHAAYNALGYSLADRGVRLPEARQLIQKALEFAPNDPYIQDSLAWVEFRLGNKREALRVIELAFQSKPDAEIAAHFGEILWSLGEREKALAIWREGLALNADNETLQETLKRLQVKP